MAWRFHSRAYASATRPEAWGQCDRCNRTYLHKNLTFQKKWQGIQLANLFILVCWECYDKPQENIRTLIIPPDPVPIMNARPENYAFEVPSFLATEPTAFFGDDITTEDDNKLIWEIEDTPNPDPNNPAGYP